MREAGKRLPPSRQSVFVCYSHANATWMDRLLVHLGPLYKEDLVDVWSYLCWSAQAASPPTLSRFQAAARDGRTLAAMTAEEAEQVLADLAAVIEEEIRSRN